MNVQIRTAAIEIEITGDQGEVVFSHKAENVDTFVNAAALIMNFGSLFETFVKVDASAMRAATASHLAKVA